MVFGIAVTVALLLPAAVNNAASGDPTVVGHLDVQADPNCATSQDLSARVLARSPRIRLADDVRATKAQAIFTVIHSGAVAAEVTLVAPAGKPWARRFVARSCGEAADAVALIIAVTLDPSSAGDPDADATTTSPSETTSDSPKTARQPASTEETRTTGSAAAMADITPSTASLALDAAVATHLIWGPAPAVMPGVALFLTAALDRDSLWSPAASLGVTHAWQNDLAQAGGTASFALDVASLDACALRVRVSIVEARACASGWLGRLSASGTKTRTPSSASRLFGVAGASAVAAAAFGSRIELWGRFGTGLTMVRDSFEFGEEVFYTASRFTTSAAVGVGIRLP